MLDNREIEWVERHVMTAIERLEQKLESRKIETVLLTAATDPKAGKALLDALKRMLAEIVEASRQLAIAREEHDAKVKADHAELDRRAARVRSDEVSLTLQRQAREAPVLNQLTGRPVRPGRTEPVGPTGMVRTVYDEVRPE